MGDTNWLALQALGTMAIVVVLAYLSWRQTRRMLAKGWPRRASPLARATPDPQFQPDPEVTDPFHVTDAHRDPARGDGAPAGPTTGHRSEAGGAREHQRTVDRAHVASLEHPSAVETLDGVVGPDGTRQGDVAADATGKPHQAR